MSDDFGYTEWKKKQARKAMANTPEGRVKKEIKKCLNNLGAYYHLPVQNGMGSPALDFHVCVPIVITPEMVGKRIGVYLGIEAKAPGKKPTPRQLETMKEIEDAGGCAVCVDTDTISEDMSQWLFIPRVK